MVDSFCYNWLCGNSSLAPFRGEGVHPIASRQHDLAIAHDNQAAHLEFSIIELLQQPEQTFGRNAFSQRRGAWNVFAN